MKNERKQRGICDGLKENWTSIFHFRPKRWWSSNYHIFVLLICVCLWNSSTDKSQPGLSLSFRLFSNLFCGFRCHICFDFLLISAWFVLLSFPPPSAAFLLFRGNSPDRFPSHHAAVSHSQQDSFVYRMTFCFTYSLLKDLLMKLLWSCCFPRCKFINK